MMRYIVLFLGLIFIGISNLVGQHFENIRSFDDLKQLRLKVIKKGIIGKKYYYDFTHDTNCSMTCIRYLGQIKTDKNKIYKILTCFYVHGISCRGTCRILIYNNNNKYIGNYHVTMPSDLPDTIINNSLVFSKFNPDCKYRKGTKISFGNGLPKTFFIPCDKVDSGDLYSFSNDE